MCPRSSHARQKNSLLSAELLEDRHLLTAILSQAFTLTDEIAPSPIESNNILQPAAYASMEIDHQRLAQELAAAPLEFTSGADQPLRFVIPDPAGGAEEFDVVETSMMAPELAKKFPEIKTYRGVGVTDPLAAVRIDISHRGFRAQVLTPNGGYHIDPYYHLDTSAYVSYYIADAAVDAATHAARMLTTKQLGHDSKLVDLHGDAASEHSHHEEFAPGLHEAGSADELTHEMTANDRHSSGRESSAGLGSQAVTLRTHRLATAATAEYTSFHGGTVADGQAAIVTTINRVSGIYEREFAVRLQLVANNDQLVYTSNPDPYSNGNGFAMLGQNQTNIDNVIGSPNYDVGHVFSTGGGGVAGLGVVGFHGSKAEGVSGQPAPIGDPFSVDYVAHELGHQYDGLHTFNGCGGGSGSAAYEPGSASTIMGYAGICGSDNLQSNSDPYFLWKNLEDVTDFVNNVIPGVGTTTSTGNSAPVADAGADYTIPRNTPFRLTGAGTDIDAGDVLTYTWEQADLGPSRSLSQSDNGQSPLFRSWEGTTDPVRTLPRINELVNNTTPVGERLPTLPRAMDWRLVVRDNAADGGGFDIDSMVVNVVNTSGGFFRVTSPNSVGVAWTGNSLETVQWNVGGTHTGQVNTPNVNIKLSTDGGFTYPITLASNVPNDGSHEILVPNINTTSARVMVEGAGNIFFDLSNFDFSIEASTVLLGDYDGSGQVAAGDLDLVLNNWGVDSATSGVPAGWIHDLPNGIISSEELDKVLNNWGNTAAATTESMTRFAWGSEEADEDHDEVKAVDATFEMFSVGCGEAL